MRRKTSWSLLIEPIKRFFTGTIMAFFGFVQKIFDFSLRNLAWYWWVIGGLSIVMWGVLDVASKKIASLEAPDVTLIFQPSTRRKVQGERDFERGILIESEDERNIHGGCADLEYAIWHPDFGKSSFLIYSGRLNWSENGQQTNECKRTIERESRRAAIFLVLDEENGAFVVPLCQITRKLEIEPPGQLFCQIKVGGIVVGNSIKPKYVISRIGIYKDHEGVALSYVGKKEVTSVEDFGRYLSILSVEVTL